MKKRNIILLALAVTMDRRNIAPRAFDKEFSEKLINAQTTE